MTVSSAEGEYVAISFVIREVTAVKVICEFILEILIIPTVYEDNKSVI